MPSYQYFPYEFYQWLDKNLTCSTYLSDYIYALFCTDNPQVQGKVVAPINVKVWGIEPQEQEGKAIYSLQLECHNSSCLCTTQIKETMEVDFNVRK